MPQFVFLFPGQGSQFVGMGKDLADAFASAREVFDLADAAAGFKLKDMCFSGPEDALTLTPNSQPCVTAVNLAALAALKENGKVPVAAAGHSLGEYAADCAAGVFTAAEALRLTRKRGELMQACADARPGSMAAIIGLDLELVKTTCAEAASASGKAVSVANYNSPEQAVITGEAAGVEKASALLTEKGAKRVVPLKVSGPWHSSLMSEAQEKFGAIIAAAEFRAPTLPVYANIDAQPKALAAEVKDALTRQVTGSVCWTQTIRALRERFPQAVFIECGPGKVLKGLMRSIDREAECHCVCDAKSVNELAAKFA